MDILLGKSFPEIHYVALICDRNDFLVCNGLAYAWDELVQIIMDLIHPALAVSLVRCMRIDLCTDAHDARNHTCLRLGTGHSSETGCHEEHSFHVLLRAFDTTGLQLLAGGIHHGDGSAVHNALRADIHI